MNALPIRLSPGQDLRRALEDAQARRGSHAAFVLSSIGSLSEAHMRFAGAAEPVRLVADLELLTLAGSLSADGEHLHATLPQADGRVIGGHVAYDCIVRTTAEVLVAMLDDWQFSRELDPASGYAELVVRPRSEPGR